jgi:hypothetical protein
VLCVKKAERNITHLTRMSAGLFCDQAACNTHPYTLQSLAFMLEEMRQAWVQLVTRDTRGHSTANNMSVSSAANDCMQDGQGNTAVL